MKKVVQFVAVLLLAVTVSFGGLNGSDSINTVDAKSKSKATEGIKMEYGSDWREGRVGYWGGCALSEALGVFTCHPSEVPWGEE